MADVDHAHEVDRNANGSRADPKLNAFTATLVSALARDDRWWPQLDQILFLAISAAVGFAVARKLGRESWSVPGVAGCCAQTRVDNE